MNKDQIKGTATDLKGKAQEAAGKLLDNDKLKAQGLKNQIVGNAEKAVGDATESVKHVLDAGHAAAKAKKEK
jgi:uncharacterized protein YjbJ (UPF0337 family)